MTSPASPEHPRGLRRMLTLERICEPMQLGNTIAIVGYLDVSHASLQRVRAAGSLKGPILWAPVPLSTVAA